MHGSFAESGLYTLVSVLVSRTLRIAMEEGLWCTRCIVRASLEI